MANQFKWTLIFEGAGKGWTESLFLERASDDLVVIQAELDDVLVKRAGLLGKEFYIKGSRVAHVTDDAGNHVTRRAKLKKGYWPGVQSERAEDSTTSLQVVMTTADGRFKKLTFLGGAWTGIFPFADAYNPDYSTWRTRFNAWVAAIRDKQLGWLHRVVFKEATITTYTVAAATGIVTYTLDPDSGWTWPVGRPPTTVSVEFPLSRSPLDGMQVVVPTGNFECKTAGPRPAYPYTIDGKIRRYRYELKTVGLVNQQGAFGTVEGQNPVGRKRGRPLLTRPGRAPARPRM